MGAINKNNAEYFSHYISNGVKRTTIESFFGNDGYAVWFKTLEILTVKDYHFYDLDPEENKLYLSAYCKVDEVKLMEILTLLARLGAIDKNLFEKGVIWSDKLVESFQELYKRRKNKCVQKEDLCNHIDRLCIHDVDINAVNVDKNQQSKVKKSKEEKSRVKIPPHFDDVKGYFFEKLNDMNASEKEAHAFMDHYHSNGWMVGKHKMKDWEAAIRNWLRKDFSNTRNSSRPFTKEEKLKNIKG